MKQQEDVTQELGISGYHADANRIQRLIIMSTLLGYSADVLVFVMMSTASRNYVWKLGSRDSTTCWPTGSVENNLGLEIFLEKQSFV